MISRLPARTRNSVAGVKATLPHNSLDPASKDGDGSKFFSSAKTPPRRKESMEVRSVLGIALLVTQASIIIPLVVELSKTRSMRGISLTSESAWVVAGVGWSIYGYLTGSTTLVISGALATLGSAVVLALVRKDAGDRMRSPLALSAAFFAAMIVTTLATGATGLGVFLSAFGVVQFVPQIVTSIKGVRSRSAHGVPLVGTAMRAVYTLVWAIYAAAWFMWGISFNEIDWPLSVWGATGFFAFTLQFVAGLVSSRTGKSKNP